MLVCFAGFVHSRRGQIREGDVCCRNFVSGGITQGKVKGQCVVGNQLSECGIAEFVKGCGFFFFCGGDDLSLSERSIPIPAPDEGKGEEQCEKRCSKPSGREKFFLCHNIPFFAVRMFCSWKNGKKLRNPSA